MPENGNYIEALRQNLRDAKSQKLGDQMMAFLRLVIHPDVTLADMLNGLEYPGVVAEMRGIEPSYFDADSGERSNSSN